MKKNIILQKGQGLIEALIALGIAAIILSSLAIVVVASVSNADKAKYRNQAAHLAQEGIDLLKQKARNDFTDTDLNVGNNYCMGGDSASIPTINTTCSSDPNVDGFFKREYSISLDVPKCGNNDPVKGNVKKVSVKVSWTDGKCSSGSLCHSVVLDTCLSDIAKN